MEPFNRHTHGPEEGLQVAVEQLAPKTLRHFPTRATTRYAERSAHVLAHSKREDILPGGTNVRMCGACVPACISV